MIHYAEFDSNSQSLLEDLRTQILTCTDWARLTPDAVLGTTTVATTTASTALTVLDTSTMGLEPGSVITIDNGTLRENRVVTQVSASTITLARALSFAHASGAEIRRGNHLYKATTTRGAQMVVDLSDGGLDTTGNGMNLAVYQTHDGTVGVGKQLKYLLWRYSGGGTHQSPLHVTLSLSKEHFFLMIEGPRPGENGAVHAQYGSFRNYFFLSDLVPYDEEDAEPVVVSGGASLVSTNASVAYNSHLGHVSKNLQGGGLWGPVRLASLQVPNAGDVNVVNIQRQRALDDRYILAPYVVFADDAGMRGRLYALFFAGFNQSTEHAVSPPPLGSKVQYQGLWYKLIAVNKGDGNRAAWGPLGIVANESTLNYQRSVVVGVPCLP